MTNKRKKVDKQNYPKKQIQPKKSLPASRLIANKNNYENSIEKIGNYVSNEMQKYDEDILRSSDILYLKSEQLSGLVEASKIFSNTEGIKFCYLTVEDVVRHPLVQKIIDAYK